MTNNQIIERLGLTVFNYANDCEVADCYCGDLLSWVMGRAEEGSCWFTIMSNLNVCAVAKLLNFACVILCEGVQPDEKMLERAKIEGINVFGTNLSTYHAVKKLCKCDK